VNEITQRKRAEAALEASARQYRVTIDSMADSMHVVDSDLRIVLINAVFDRWCDRLGIPRARVGQGLIEAFPMLPARVLDEYRLVFQTGAPLETVETTEVAGSQVFTETRKVPVIEDGKISLVITLVRDITEREHMRNALRERAGHQAILNTIPDVAWMKDMAGRFVAVNSAACAFMGRSSPEEVIGKTAREILPQGMAEAFGEEDQAVVRSGQPVRRVSVLSLPGGGSGWFDTIKKPVFNARGAVVATVGISRDITDRKAAEESLEKLTAQLRALATQLVQAEEQERQRVAKILHDDLQQMLTGAKYALSVLGKTTSRKERERGVAEIERVLTQAIQTTRSLSLDFRPPALYESGIAEALRWLAKDLKDKFGLAVRVQVDAAAEALPEALRILVFQAARELLLNVKKHAGVKTAQVRVGPDGDDRICVEVEDKGAGFEAAESKPGCLGLFNIRERVAHFGGRLEIHSEPGRGTRVRLTVPRR
jgi:two-component system, NarL family, sensor histidine kinase UhpB